MSINDSLNLFNYLCFTFQFDHTHFKIKNDFNEDGWLNLFKVRYIIIDSPWN